MRRRLALVLLGLGAVLGFASGFQQLRHHGLHGHPGHHSCYLDGRSWPFEF
ncbi:MAG TPA: hypothetical protein VMG12_41705 [Polyangiaceae bacterium]|nr:hypothetical protein [Polyangiaceae bacterium]